MNIDYPIAVDSEHLIWRTFKNNYWPALYFVDSQGRVRHHHFGEGSYEQSEMIIQALLAEAGATGINREPVAVNARGIEAAADWATCGPPKTMSGMAAPRTLRLPAAQSWTSLASIKCPRCYA